MKILFKRTEESANKNELTFKELGITQCFVKSLSTATDKRSTLRTVHRHALYEVHIIFSGSQDYEIGDEKITVSSGELLLIAPYTNHLAVSETEDSRKGAINFALAENCELSSMLSHISSHVITKVPENLLYLLNFISEEKTRHEAFSDTLSELYSLECILLILRAVGASDAEAPSDTPMPDVRVAMAKQFIQDNIQYNITMSDLSSYCHLSTKQISRIFCKAEGCSIAEYIRIHKIKRIKSLLAENDSSIRKISELMNFSSEYYLNSFFKKHTGMTPGAYRKAVMLKK